MSDDLEQEERRHFRRRTTDNLVERVSTLESTVRDIKTLQEQDSAQLDRIEDKTDKATSATSELVEVLEALKGAGKVVGWIAKMGKPLSAFAGVVVAWHTLGGWNAAKLAIKEFFK